MKESRFPFEKVGYWVAIIAHVIMILLSVYCIFKYHAEENIKAAWECGICAIWVVCSWLNLASGKMWKDNYYDLETDHNKMIEDYHNLIKTAEDINHHAGEVIDHAKSVNNMNKEILDSNGRLAEYLFLYAQELLKVDPDNLLFQEKAIHDLLKKDKWDKDYVENIVHDNLEDSECDL